MFGAFLFPLPFPLGKCEIYSTPYPASLPTQSATIPVIVEHDKWSYLGNPLFEQTDIALQAVLLTSIAQTAQLASLMNIAQKAAEFGASPQFVSHYMARVHSVTRPDLAPSKDLQKGLTQPLHQLSLDALLRTANDATRLQQRG